ncbi:MAG: hypothetical protein ACRDI0_12265 [Actinomycetota bacterium]
MERSTSQPHPGTPTVRPAAPVPLLAAVPLAGGATALALVDMPIAAGASVAATGGALVLSASWSRGSRRLTFADATMERLLDAAVLGAVAWAALPERPVIAAAALVALAASYLASYLRAKAVGLGFPVEDRPAVRGVRWGIVALGLLIPPALAVALWASAGMSLAHLALEARAIARRELR